MRPLADREAQQALLEQLIVVVSRLARPADDSPTSRRSIQYSVENRRRRGRSTSSGSGTPDDDAPDGSLRSPPAPCGTRRATFPSGFDESTIPVLQFSSSGSIIQHVKRSHTSLTERADSEFTIGCQNDRVQRRLTGIAVGAIAALTFGGAGCANCEQVGCSSGAFVELTNSPKGRSGATVARLCVGRSCRRFELAGGVDFLEGDVPNLDPDDIVEVSVSLRDSRNAVFGRASGRFAPTALQPNGSDCPPTCQVISLRYDAREETLTEAQR